MQDKYIPILFCPECKIDLEVYKTTSDSGDIAQGSLRCIKCKKDYPIENGVPEFNGLIKEK